MLSLVVCWLGVDVLVSRKTGSIKIGLGDKSSRKMNYGSLCMTYGISVSPVCGDSPRLLPHKRPFDFLVLVGELGHDAADQLMMEKE